MKAGDKITIASARAVADGFVGALYSAADVARVPDAPHLKQVKDALTDGTWLRVALLEYSYLGQTRGFMALEDTSGRWWDLRGTQLAIEVHQKQAELFDRGTDPQRQAKRYPN